MSRIVNIREREDRQSVAGRWIARMDRGLSPEEAVALQEWMAADSRNAAELLSMAQNWDEMDDLARLAELFPENTASRKPRNSIVGPLRAAAAVAGLAVLAVVLWSLSDIPGAGAPVAETPPVDLYETTVGEQSTAVLSDGSVVVLNTNSRMQVVYSDTGRLLLLQRGEIHVEVAHDPLRPLSVVAGGRIVQAVGTSFSVEITPDDRIELVVTEGKVIVGVVAADREGDTPPDALTEQPDNTVAAGEEIVLGAKDESVKPVSKEDIEVRLSWREGRLIFRGESLEYALAEVERYTTVQFVFLEQDLKTRSVTGRFRAGDVEGLLAALRTNFNIGAEHLDDGQVLLSSL